MPTGAVRSRIAPCAVVAQCASVGSAAGLLSISAGRVALRLVQVIAAAILVLYSSGGLLVQSSLTCGRLIWPCLPSAARLIRSGLGGSAQLLSIVLGQILLIVAKLRLIVFLIEVRSGHVIVTRRIVEVVDAIVAIQVVTIDVVRVDVIAVDIIAIDVVRIDVIPIDIVAVYVVVVVVAVDEGVRIRDIDVAVVSYR